MVSFADVYDALISERVYKKAYSHERALHMILNGECGAFNPLLLECLRDIADRIEEELTINSLSWVSENMLEEHPENDYVMVIMDMDCFKMANSERGHLFGDRILKYLADCLLTNIREDDLAARVGGDEFLVFVHDDGKWGNVVRRIFTTLTGEYEGFRLSVSMGIAKTKIVGRDYQKLYQGADMALFQAKKKGKGCYACYDGVSCSQEIPTEISPIDQAPEEG